MSIPVRVGLVLLVISGCGGGGGGSPDPKPLTGWAAIRAATVPEVALPDEYGTPKPQKLAVDGWEDGIFISRDGLNLYAVYAPADLMSFTLAGGDQVQAIDYLRGPTFGMDLTTLPAGLPEPQPARWLHGNIVHASRSSTAHPFTAWSLVAMSRPVWSEGAPMGTGASGGTWDLFVYTSNEHAPDYQPHICLKQGAPYDPDTLGTMLPAPVTSNGMEDNPHIERLSPTSLVLFYDSDRNPGTTPLGARDIWYTTSADDGVTWAAPVAVSSLNTGLEEQQPHLWQDGLGDWWIYFTGTNPGDGKLGIFRARQLTVDDWNSWGAKELVVGAGTSEGIGEPSLTEDGDLSFVVITKDPDAAARGDTHNVFDADPWFLPRRPVAAAKAVTPAASRPVLASSRRPWQFEVE